MFYPVIVPFPSASGHGQWRITSQQVLPSTKMKDGQRLVDTVKK
jgi:hypothetical protein